MGVRSSASLASHRSRSSAKTVRGAAVWVTNPTVPRVGFSNISTPIPLYPSVLIFRSTGIVALTQPCTNRICESPVIDVPSSGIKHAYKLFSPPVSLVYSHICTRHCDTSHFFFLIFILHSFLSRSQSHMLSPSHSHPLSFLDIFSPTPTLTHTHSYFNFVGLTSECVFLDWHA